MSGILQGLIGSLKSAASSAADAYFNLTTLLLNTSSTNGAQNNTFLDSSTNNFTITRNGNTTQGTFTPFSQTGWSNYFNGSSDYLSFTSSANFAFGTGDYTVETWVYLTSTSTYQTLFGSATTDALMFNIYNMNEVVIQTAGSNIFATFSGATFATNTWYHVAVSRSSGTVKAFVNGTQYGSTITSNTTNYAQPSSNSIGANSSSQYFGGYLSNLRVNKGTAVYTSAFTPSTTPLTAISGTSLLTCQSNRFLDNSTSAIALTVNGTPSVQAFSPFAPTAAYDTAVVGGSGYFDGSGDYLNFTGNANTSIGGNDWTIEAWVYSTSFSEQYQQVLRGETSNMILLMLETTAKRVQCEIGGGASAYSPTTLQLNTWNHCAVVRNGSNVTVYLNGVGGTPVAMNPTTTSSEVFRIGTDTSTARWLNGYVCGLRLVKGTAVYTANFTPPTAPPTAITNTQLLLNFTNAGIYDSTAKNVLETVGNAQVSTTQAKWGTTSMAFDGNGDYLSIPNTSLLQLGSSDWTIECWAYISSTTGDQRPISQNNSNYEFAFFMSSGGAMSAASYQSGGSTNFNISMGTLSAGQWYHLAASRSGSTVRAFVNGTLQNSATYSGTIDARTGGWRLGASYVPGDYFNGYLDDVRITLGYARYTANFTAPTAAFPVQ